MSQDVAAKYPFHAIIFDYVVTKRTGILTFEPGSRKLFFEAGQLVFANSEEPSEHFSSILVNTGIFSQEQLDQTKQETGPGKSLGKQLKAKGFATSQQLAHALKQQITSIVDATLSQSHGDCHTTEKPLPARLPKLKIQTLGLIIKSIFKMDTDNFSMPIQLDQPLIKTAIGDLNLSKIAIPPAYLELFNFLHENSSFSPDALQEIAQLDGDQLQKMVYILHQLGVIAIEEDSSAIQEPLAELTDEETFQDDTLGEDALATVLPSTTPPKTDPTGNLDPLRAVRQINLPSFVQEPAPDQLPTLRVQDPRKIEPVELEETVRQFQPGAFGSEPNLDASNQIPKLEDALALDQDISTISRELDPGDLLHISEDEEEEDLLPIVKDLEDDGETAPVEENFEEAQAPLLPDTETSELQSPLRELTNLPAFDDPPTFDDASLHDGSKTELKDLINTPDMEEEGNFEPTVFLDVAESKFNTEPALARPDFAAVTPLSETQTLPTGFQTEIPELDGPETISPVAPVIMPTQEDESNFYLENPQKKPKSSLLKWVAALLLLGVLGFVGYRLYENKTGSDLTADYLEENTSEPPLEASNQPKMPITDDAIEENQLEDPELNQSDATEQEGAAPASSPEETAIPEENVVSPTPEVDGVASTLSQEEPQPLINDTSSQERAKEDEPEVEAPLPKPVIPATDQSTFDLADNPFAEQLQQSQTQFQEQNATHSLVVMVACQSSTVQNAMERFGSADVYLIPRTVDGKSCWMLTWGAFPSYSQAVEARVNFPQELRQGNDAVWVVKPSW